MTFAMQQPQSNALWAKHLLRPLLQQGLKHAVVSPGSRHTPLLLALVESGLSDLQIWPIVDERQAAFFALGLSRATLMPVALLCTSGSALGHYLPAVMEAYHSELPLFVLSGDRPQELHFTQANQTTEQYGLLSQHVVFERHIEAPFPGMSGCFLEAIMWQALLAAKGSPSGPVHLNVAFREPLWQRALLDDELFLDDGSQAQNSGQKQSLQPRYTHCLATSEFSKQSVHSLLEVLRNSGPGIIFCGSRLVNASDDAAMLEALKIIAEKLDVVVLAETASQLRFTQGHPRWLVDHDLLLEDEAFAEAIRPCWLLRLGDFAIGKKMQTLLATAEHLIWLTRHVGYLSPPPSLFQAAASAQKQTWLIGQPLQWLQLAAQQCQLLTSQSPTPSIYQSLWQDSSKNLREKIQPWLQPTEPLWEALIWQCLCRHLPQGSVVQIGNSLAIRDADHFAWQAPASLFYAQRGLSGIDGHLCGALGLSACYPQIIPLLVLGDLTFFHDAQALLLGREFDLPLRVLVINNNGGGIFDTLAIHQHPSAFEPFFRMPQKASIAKICQAYGVKHHAVNDVVSLDKALAHWFDAKVDLLTGIEVLEVCIDPHMSKKSRQRLLASCCHHFQGHASSQSNDTRSFR